MKNNIDVKKDLHKSGNKAIGIAIAVIMLASIFAVFTPIISAQGPHTPPRNVPVPEGDEAIYYLYPRESTATGYCNDVTIDVWVNTSGLIPALRSGSVQITTSDELCGNMYPGVGVGCTCNSTEWTTSCTCTCLEIEGQMRTVITYRDPSGQNNAPGNYPVGTFKVHGNSSAGCLADLNFIPEKPYTYVANDTLPLPVSSGVTGESGIFACGVTIETFSKYLFDGWNLVSLPIKPSDNSTSAVLGGTIAYDAVYSYNTATKQFEDIKTGTMDFGIGYFVHVTTAGTWTYSGIAETSINVPLEQGLNMVGWLNCSKSISDGLSSIDGNYYYVARWNAAEKKFETYNPVAPSGFNDFADMERGEGYFISAKAESTLSESC